MRILHGGLVGKGVGAEGGYDNVAWGVRGEGGWRGGGL